MRFYQIGSHESRQKPSSSELIIFHVHFRCLSGPARDPRQTAFKFNMNLCAFDSELERTRAKNRKARCRTQVEPTKGPLEANKATPQEILDRPREVNAFFINHFGLRPFVAFNHRKIFVSFFSSPKKTPRNETKEPQIQWSWKQHQCTHRSLPSFVSSSSWASTQTTKSERKIFRASWLPMRRIQTPTRFSSPCAVWCRYISELVGFEFYKWGFFFGDC